MKKDAIQIFDQVPPIPKNLPSNFIGHLLHTVQGDTYTFEAGYAKDGSVTDCRTKLITTLIILDKLREEQPSLPIPEVAVWHPRNHVLAYFPNPDGTFEIFDYATERGVVKPRGPIRYDNIRPYKRLLTDSTDYESILRATDLMLAHVVALNSPDEDPNIIQMTQDALLATPGLDQGYFQHVTGIRE